MEAHLQSLKVPDLKSLLQAASLPVSGNKAELIKRLLEHPEATRTIAAGLQAEPQASKAPPAPPAKAASPVTNAPAEGQKKKETIAKAASTASAPKATSSGPAPAAPQPDTQGATSSSSEPQSTEDARQVLIAELEKRKARAARFGQEQSEADRKLERAIKFGLKGSDEASLALLDKELAASRKSNQGTASSAEKATKGSAEKKVLTEEEKAQKEKERLEVKARKDKEREAMEEEKKKRAERFGLINKEEEEKKRKRAERFGGMTAALTTNGNEPAGKKVKT